MIVLILFWEFLRIGVFAFGKAYGKVSPICEAVLSWWQRISFRKNNTSLFEMEAITTGFKRITQACHRQG